jgi:uncharacterized membrane protein YfcA
MSGMEMVAAYLATGAFAGFMAGLLGVGGGLIIVPALVFVYAAQAFPAQYAMHLALGTSLASIMFTSISSLRAHHAHGAVNWAIVKGISPGIVAGTLAGTVLATWLSSQFLKGFFVAFIYYVATQMLLGFKPKPHRDLPGAAGMFGAGSVIGGISSLVGIGGGTLSVPFMTWCNVKLHQAIGTSSAIGFPIAVSGAVGYLANGWGVQNLPAWSLGFVHLPSLAVLVVASVFTAPLGAKAAHKLPVATLKKVFAVFLYIVGTRMLLSLF